MWAYDDDLGRGRRTRDLPRSSAGPSRSTAYYYDDTYDRPTYSSSRYQQLDSQPQPSSSHRSHRRESVTEADLGEPTKSSSSRHANVIASDDGSDFYRRTTRDAYAYPERTSRHDIEAKTGDRSRKFREKRGSYEMDESQNLRRAKSHSPRRAAREVEASRNPSPPTAKSAWGEEAADAYGRTTSSKKSSSKAPQQHYDTDPYATDYAKYRDRNAGGYDYTSAGMPRPPMGAASSAAPPEEKPSKHSRRSKHHHSSAEDDFAAATAPDYDLRGAAAAYAVDEKPSRHRSHHSSKPRDDPVDPFATQSRRGRHRGVPPTAGGPEDYYDSYTSRSAPPPRAKQRQSMPPRTRSRYDGLGEGAEGAGVDYGEDSYYNPASSRRRAASVNHGAGYYGDRHGSDPGKGRRERPQQYYDDDDRYDARGSRGAGGSPSGGPPGRSSSRKEKGKQWQKQAGKLFMTHAVPVIKKEAVPFLTKAAQAYFEQKR